MNTNIESDKNINLKINDDLLPYVLFLPVHISHSEALSIHELLQSPDKNKHLIVSATIERIVMQPHARAVWLENRLFLIPCFHDLCSIVDYAYIGYGRGNHVDAYFSLIPIAEGIILRWMGYFDRKDKKPTFKEMKNYINDKKKNDKLLNSHHFVGIWIDTLSNILCDEFFKDTWEEHTIDYFNRHVGGHLIKLFKLTGINGLVMRLFMIIELIVEIYVVENKYVIEGTSIPLLFKTSEQTNKRLRAYKLSYDWLGKDLINHPEAILKGMYEK
jgi:hypothetical protein